MNIAAHLALFESAVATTKANIYGVESSLDHTVDHVIALLEAANKVVVIGNGGSAAVASHVVNDLMSCGVPTITLTDPAVMTCMANDFGYEQVFTRQLSIHKPNVVITISSSGKSPNIIMPAMDMIMVVIGFTGFAPDNPSRRNSDISFHVPSYDYGIVEVAHQFILHNITDRLKAMSKASKVAAE